MGIIFCCPVRFERAPRAVVLPDPQNLHLTIPGARLHPPPPCRTARAPAARRTRRALRRVGLVLADDAEGLPAAVVARDGDGRAELHAVGRGRRFHQLRAGAPRAPVAQVALGQRRSGLSAARRPRHARHRAGPARPPWRRGLRASPNSDAAKPAAPAAPPACRHPVP